MQKQISSPQNPAIKKLLQLQEKARARKKEGLFVIEGFRELTLAIKGGYELQEIYCCPDLCTPEQIAVFKDVPLIEISLNLYHKIAYRSGTEGLIALARTKDLELKSLELTSNRPLILVAEAPEKPGNIGALLRTADAANVDVVIIANPKTDLFNPNIVRSSVGGLFTNQIALGSTPEIIEFLNVKNIPIYAAILQESVNYLQVDFTRSAAIVMGTEASGLSETWRKNATQNIHIAMRGEIDSMNVSVAAGILIFEALRQRG